MMRVKRMGAALASLTSLTAVLHGQSLADTPATPPPFESCQAFAAAPLDPDMLVGAALTAPAPHQVDVTFALRRAEAETTPPKEENKEEKLLALLGEWLIATEPDPDAPNRMLYRFEDAPGSLIAHAAASLDLTPLPVDARTSLLSSSINRTAARRAGLHRFPSAFGIGGEGVRIAMHEFASPQANHPDMRDFLDSRLEGALKSRLEGALRSREALRAAFASDGARLPACSDPAPSNAWFRLCHATHVMGTLASSSDDEAEGMAPLATVVAAAALTSPGLWTDPEVMTLHRRADVSNHSYAPGCAGRGRCADPAQLFLLYTNLAAAADQAARDGGPLAVFSAGNNRAFHLANPWPCGGGDTVYGTLGGPGAAKNVLTVGSLMESERQALSAFSDVGPTVDGRIKPEVVANGESLYSIGVSWGDGEPARFWNAGTSMAAPVVAGAGALLQGLARFEGGERLSSYGLRGLIIQGACPVEPGAARQLAGTCGTLDHGPTYETGFGAVDALVSGCALVGENGGVIDRLEIAPGGRKEFSLTRSEAAVSSDCVGFDGFAATLTWADDPEERPDRVGLIQDLELHLVSPSGATIRPWTLNPQAPAAPAVRGEDRLNTVEKITLPNAEIIAEPGVWTLVVTTHATDRTIPFALAWSGMIQADP